MRKLLRSALFVAALWIGWIPVSGQTADFTFTPDSMCNSMTVSFTDQSGPGVTSWNWSFGLSTQNPQWTFGPGSHSVTLTVRGASGTTTKTKTITVFADPAPTFTAATTSGCVPFTTTFTGSAVLNGPGPATYSWDFGDGNSGTGPTPVHTYSNPGTYRVTLTATNGANCTKSFSRNNYITVHDNPVASFTADTTTFCRPSGTAAFTNTSFGGKTPYTAAWSWGDNTTGSGNTTSKTYSGSGYYTVQMIVTDANGCKDTALQPNYIGVVGQVPTFTAPLQACVNQDVQVSNMTTGAVSATDWNFGDGSPIKTGSTAKHIYLAPGTDTIVMTTTVAGCVKVAKQQIIVHPNPGVTIVQSPSIPCPAPVTVSFTGTPTGTGYTISDYNWSFKSGGTATGQSVLHNYTANGYDEVKLYTTSSNGCRDSVIVDTVAIRRLMVNVTPGSLCSPDTLAGCNPVDANFGIELYSSLPPPAAPCAYVRYPAADVTWKWNFGDGIGTSTAAFPNYRYRSNGTFKATCVITTDNGCKDSSFRWVHVDSPVKPSFYVSPTETCPKELVTIFNTTANHRPGTKYTFLISNLLGTDTTIMKLDASNTYNRFKKFGTYDIHMYSNYNGCTDSAHRWNYVRILPPHAKFIDSVYCYPSLGAAFKNLSDSATDYEWDFGDGTPKVTQTNPSHTYATTGDYLVTLTAFNRTYNCSDQYQKLIHIFKPDISFVADDTAICKNDFVTFEGAFGGIGEIQYSWRIGNYRTGWDTARKYLHRFSNIGYYDITMFAISGNNCLDSFQRSKYVLTTSPTVMFDSQPHVGCEPMDVVITDNSTNVPGVPTVIKYWVLGNGDSISFNQSNSISYTYKSRGIFNPKLVLIDSLGCTDSLVRNGYVQVYKPTAVFTTSDDSLCTYEAVRFKSFSTGKAPLRFNWDFGDNTPAGTTDTISHRYMKPGTYHVRLVVTDSVGCTDTMHIQNDIVVDGPTAGFRMKDSVSFCDPPFTTQFTDESIKAAQYRWDFGDGIILDKPAPASPVHSFLTIGAFNIVMVVYDANGCTDTARNQMKILGYPGALDYTPLLGCAPMNVNFSTIIPGIPELTWDFGDGVAKTTTNSAPTSHTYTTPGTYLPKVVFSDGKVNGCRSKPSLGLDSIRVDKLTPNFNWSIPCEGVPFTLTDASAGIYSAPTSFSWSFAGTGGTATGQSTQFTYPSSGTRQVTLTVTNGAGCTETITKDVYINPSPDLNAMADTAICPGDTAQLRADNAVTYTWSPAPQNPAAGLSCTNCQNPRAWPGGAATYLVTGTDANGCIGHDSTQIRIQIKTTASTGDGGEICLGESFRLRASGAQKYEWLPAATVDSPFIASPLATPRGTTTYIVAAQEGTCLIDSQRITVVVRTSPDFTAGPDKVINLGASTTLEPKGNYRSIVWLYKDSTLSCDSCPNPNAHPYYTRTYVAEVENEWGCKSWDSVTVFVRCNGSEVFIPNTFTPNGDGKNDYFYPQGVGLDRIVAFRVFNRWGEPLFEKLNVMLNDERAGWDGSYKGQLLSPDTYIYSMTGRCPTGEIIELKGDVTILR